MNAGVEILEDLRAMGRRARAASRLVARGSPEAKTAALRAAAEAVRARRHDALEVNGLEIDAAQADGATAAFIDRMRLDAQRIEAIAGSLEAIAAQADPVGEVFETWRRPNGLEFARVRVPIGVVAVIYESRPNVTVDAAAIALKAGSAAILRGGSECIGTSRVLHAAFLEGLERAGLPRDAAQLVPYTDRAAVGAMLGGLDGAIDLLVPRGGRSLVARVVEEARAPVLAHLDGLCHVYVDRAATIAMAVDIVVNGKMRRTGVCGATETLLIDRAILDSALAPIAAALRAAGCELRGDEMVRAVDATVLPASETDWRTEYLDAILSIRAVDGLEGALAHINEYGSGHTDAIVTEDADAATRFLAEVDSAIVLHNASTQFADGGEFGLGAEIGIATGKLHARGPVGARELTSYKTIVRGCGQVRP